MLQLQYWELSLAELEDSSLGLELSTFFQHVGYNAATEILRQEVKSFQPQSHSSSLPSTVAWITGECQISRDWIACWKKYKNCDSAAKKIFLKIGNHLLLYMSCE